MDPKPVLLFIHLPKTAGTSLRHFLQSGVPEGALFPNEHDLKTHPDIYHHFPSFALHAPQRVREAELICGHLPYHKLRSLITRSTVCLTMLRHPARRALSELLHHRRLGSAELRDMPIDAMAAGYPHLYQPQWRYLGNTPQAAHEALRAFDWVGVQEHFGESLALLAHRLGRPLPDSLPVMNVTPPDAETLSESSLALLRERLHDDFTLYAAAQEKLRADYRCAFGRDIS